MIMIKKFNKTAYIVFLIELILALIIIILIFIYYKDKLKLFFLIFFSIIFIITIGVLSYKIDKIDDNDSDNTRDILKFFPEYNDTEI